MPAGYIDGFFGPEGAGKSAGMVATAITHGILVAQASGYRTYEEYCVDHDPVIYTFDGLQIHSAKRWKHKLPKEKTCLEKDPETGDLTGNEGKLLLSRPMDFEDWITNFGAARYSNILVLIDEMQNWFSIYAQNSKILELVSRGLAQRRRRKLGIMYTAQNPDWIPTRIRWMTHYYTVCRDASWGPSGREKGLKRGEILNMTKIDMKGFHTGEPGKVLGKRVLIGKKVWPFYDSFGHTSIFAGEIAAKVKKRQLNIDPGGTLEQPVPWNEVREAQRMVAQMDERDALMEQLSGAGLSMGLLQKASRAINPDGYDYTQGPKRKRQ